MASLQNRRKLFPPFPYAGGKRRVVHEVWLRFGEVGRYFEPFAGGLAVLLGNPYKIPVREHVVDNYGHIVNVWRTLQKNPEVIRLKICDQTSTIGLRHADKKIVNLNDKLLEDETYYDAEIAAAWVFRACNTVWGTSNTKIRSGGRPSSLWVNESVFDELKERLRDVNVHFGEWDSILNSAFLEVKSYSTYPNPSMRAIFFDPPYVKYEAIYENYESNIAKKVESWIVENQHPKIRMCLAGHKGDYPTLENDPAWECVEWKRVNGKKSTTEILLFSPNCIKVEDA